MCVESNEPRDYMDERQSCGIPGAFICGDGAAPGSEPFLMHLNKTWYLVHLKYLRPPT